MSSDDQGGTAAWLGDGGGGAETAAMDYPATGSTPAEAWSDDPGDYELPTLSSANGYGDNEPVPPMPAPVERRSWWLVAAAAAGILVVFISVARDVARELPGKLAEMRGPTTTAPVAATAAPRDPATRRGPTSAPPLCAPGHNADWGCLPVDRTTPTTTVAPTPEDQHFLDRMAAQRGSYPALSDTGADLRYAHKYCEMIRGGDGVGPAVAAIQAESGWDISAIVALGNSAAAAYPEC